MVVGMIQKVHTTITGTSSRGIAYAANDPDLSAWVHYSLVHSFLKTYQLFGYEPLTQQEANKFVAEHIPLGKLLHLDVLLETEAELDAWICNHPDLGRVNSQALVLKYLLEPPMGFMQLQGYKLFTGAVVATLPEPIRCFANSAKTHFSSKIIH